MPPLGGRKGILESNLKFFIVVKSSETVMKATMMTMVSQACKMSLPATDEMPIEAVASDNESEWEVSDFLCSDDSCNE